MNKNLRFNAILNVIRTCLSIVFPLITYPYAARTLGTAGLGKVAYGSSIISYLTMLAMLGVPTYAVREGSKYRNNKTQLNKFVNQIFTLNICFTLFTYILLFFMLIFVRKLQDYKYLIILQSISIIFNTFSVTWLNTIYEDFLLITIRSIVTHCISLILLFLFVRSANDYYIYAALFVVNDAITCLSNWVYCKRYVKIRLVSKLNFSTHIFPLLILFANSLAVSIYVNIDITMLGWIKGDNDVGKYSIAVKIYTVIKNVMAAIYAVVIPRLASLYSKSSIEEYKNLYSCLWIALSGILVPTAFGLMCFSNEAMLLMGGEAAVSASSSLKILCVGLIFAIYGGLITSCLNIIIGQEKQILQATVLSAILNTILNLILIPKYTYNAAAFTTAVSEAFVFFFCITRIGHLNIYLDFSVLRKSIPKIFISASFMFLLINIVKTHISNVFIKILFIIPLGCFVYFIFLLILKEPFLYKNIARRFPQITND